MDGQDNKWEGGGGEVETKRCETESGQVRQKVDGWALVRRKVDEW